EGERRGAALVIDRDEVDGMRGCEQGGPVAGHARGRTVLSQPTPGERIGQSYRFRHLALPACHRCAYARPGAGARANLFVPAPSPDGQTCLPTLMTRPAESR